MKQKILFILHLPPPIHGASMASKYIHDSISINETYATDYINLMTACSLNDVGKGGLKKLFVFLKILSNVFSYISKKKYDLCYVTLNAKGPSFYKDLIIVIILKIFRKKIIYHFHNKGVAAGSKFIVNRFFYRIAFTNAKCILLTPKLYYDIERYVKRKDVYYCPNGIPIMPNSLGTIEKTVDSICRILFLSNMMEEKGVYLLLEAAKLLKEKFAIAFECHFIGAWSDISEEKFNEKVFAYDLSNYVFAHGKKYGEDKYCFYRNSDIFVFPTYYHNEVFPLVILEAMQFALPVVSTIIGGVPDEVIDGETGYLVPQKDIEKLAEKLKILIDDPILREQMGSNGYQHFIEHFTLKKYENNLIRIFDEVI